MKSTELIHRIAELSEIKDKRQITNLLKSLRKATVYEIIKELLKTNLSDIRLTDLPGKLYRRTYGLIKENPTVEDMKLQKAIEDWQNGAKIPEGLGCYFVDTNGKKIGMDDGKGGIKPFKIKEDE